MQQAPPFIPTNAFTAAELFTYVIGTIRSPGMIDCKASQQSFTSSHCAMSAIEQPAERSGRSTCTELGVRMSAVSAMK